MTTDAERARSFGKVAGDYDRLRPSPPDAAVDWLVPEHCAVAVDLAAGTGLLTRALARRVPEVIAVEPDDRMAAVLRARSPGARVVRAVGEDLPLETASVDGVFIQSAWHWLDPDRAIPQIARVLRAGGCFGALWPSRDPSVDWVAGVSRAWQGESPAEDDPSAPARDRAGRDHAGRDDAGRDRAGRGTVQLPADGLFEDEEISCHRYTRTMTAGDFLGLLGTYSRVITAAPADQAAGHERARAYLEQRFPGADQLEVPLRVRVWRARRTDCPAPG